MDWNELFEQGYKGFTSTGTKDDYMKGFKAGVHAAISEFEKAVNESNLSLPTRHYVLRLMRSKK